MKVNAGASDKEPPGYISSRMGLREGQNAVTKGINIAYSYCVTKGLYLTYE